MGVDGLLPRWNSILGNKKLIVELCRALLPDKEPNNRGQPLKHPIKNYTTLIILKEDKKSSLRDAETDWSEYVCGKRVDHSVIGYWERNIDPRYMEKCVRTIGSFLEFLLGYLFTVIDATRFSNWHMDETGFHLLTRISHNTVYPVNICPDTLDPVPNTKDALVFGEGFLMGDKWYDVNKVFKEVYGSGYTPLISPQKTRDSGHWRGKGRKVYNKNKKSYRQRGRGESTFGSLTNEFGDRLDTRMKQTTYIRSIARVMSYQIKILIRATYSEHTICLMNN